MTDDPEDTAPAEITTLRLVVQRLSRRIRRQSETGLTPSRLSALSALARNGPLTPGQLAEKEQLAKSSVTRLVAHLEGAHLIERQPDVDDGRSWKACLTDDGRALLDAASSRADAYLERQLDHLSPAERASLLQAVPVFERLLEIRA